MSFLGDSARYIHVLFGSIGLVAFWIPIFTTKGAVNLRIDRPRPGETALAS